MEELLCLRRVGLSGGSAHGGKVTKMGSVEEVGLGRGRCRVNGPIWARLALVRVEWNSVYCSKTFIGRDISTIMVRLNSCFGLLDSSGSGGAGRAGNWLGYEMSDRRWR